VNARHIVAALVLAALACGIGRAACAASRPASLPGHVVPEDASSLRTSAPQHVRARIAIGGFSADEVLPSLEFLRKELSARTVLENVQADWDAARERIVVTAQTEGHDPRVVGGDAGLVYDEVYESIFATMPENDRTWTFDVEESSLVEL
jgi:hypothetical protein